MRRYWKRSGCFRNFETPQSKLLQIVLAGQAQLEEKLGQKQMAQLLQRITMVKHLEALSPEETAGYVRHRLKVAGHCGARCAWARPISNRWRARRLT